MDEFFIYLRLGFHHVADLTGYDHILFIAALAVMYAPKDWKQLAVLVTAFTLGHSVTLALATLQLVAVPSTPVETLIPITIIVTALLALIEQRHLTADGVSEVSAFTAVHDDRRPKPLPPTVRYALALCFGLVHGLGFSTYLRALLGDEQSLVLPLFAFNVGLEFGQLVILSVVLALGTLVTALGLTRRRWVQVVAITTSALATVLLVNRLRGGA